MRAERLLDYQRNSQKTRPWDEGGVKEGRKRTGGTERGKAHKHRTEALSFTGRGTPIANAFSQAQALREIKKSNLYSIPSQRRLPCSSACIFVNTASSEQLNLPCANAGWRRRRGDGMRRLGRRGQYRPNCIFLL